MSKLKGGSPIKVVIAFLILAVLFVVAIYGVQTMSSSVDDYTDENTGYFEESETEESSLENKEKRSNNQKELLEAHYRPSNVAFAL